MYSLCMLWYLLVINKYDIINILYIVYLNNKYNYGNLVCKFYKWFVGI